MNTRSYVELTADRCEVECLHPEHVKPLLGRIIEYAESDLVGSVFTLLADSTRLRIVHALSLSDELCVCDMALLLGLSQSAVSHQLRVLRAHRAVARRKAGRLVYYRLEDQHVRKMLVEGISHSREAAAATRDEAADGP